MKKWIIIFVSVIILLMLFLCRFKYFTSIDGRFFVRINRITGIAKLYKFEINSGELIDIKRVALKKARIKRKNYVLKLKKQFEEETDWDLSGLEKGEKK